MQLLALSWYGMNEQNVVVSCVHNVATANWIDIEVNDANWCV